MKLLKSSLTGSVIFIFLFLIVAVNAQAQNIENRVDALEEYVETFQPTLIEFSEELQRNIQKYTQGLEDSLQNYSKNLQQKVNSQIKTLNRKQIVIDPNSPAFQSVESNAGTFLVSVDRVERLPSGVFRLYLNLGNYNFADYKGFIVKLVWGPKFYPGYGSKIEEWRDTLNGTEYTFDGTLYKGVWNQVEVDINAENSGDLAHIEFEITVLSVELKSQ